MKTRRSFLNFGFTTILTTFVMICILTFSVLTLLTAYSDYKLSQKVAVRTSSYYEAEEQAYARLADIDEQLAGSYLTDTGATVYRLQAAEALSAYGEEHPELNLTLTECDGRLTVTYCIFVTDTQNLMVELDVLPPQTNGGTYYRLIRWQTINTVSAESENAPMNLIGT